MVNYNENDIRKAAYYIWKNSNGKHCDPVQNWNMAIKQLNEKADLDANLAALALAKSISGKIKAAPFSGVYASLMKKNDAMNKKIKNTKK
jgi:hypothetical protein